MRCGVIILAGFVLAGCAASHQVATQSPPAQRHYLPASASALAFNPSITRDQPPLELSRDVRERAAIVGIDEVSITYFDIRMNDRQTNDFTDRFERQAVSQRVGVSYR